MKKRISFSQHDALRIYEWRLAYLATQGGEDDCGQCPRIEERLKKFVDKEELKYLHKLIKENPFTTNTLKD